MLFYDIGQNNKPHVHAYYGECEAVIAIDGFSPSKADKDCHRLVCIP